MEKIIKLDQINLENEHICCAFSDKKCKPGYELKKDWLRKEFDNGYVFRRLDARAKVFIEYGPAENAWVPVTAPNYLLVNCFWVSGQYKQNGYGKELLKLALEDAESQGKTGLVTVVGTKKLNFMSDTKWLLKQGFEVCDQLSYGFSLLVKKLDSNLNVIKLNPEEDKATFNDSALNGKCFSSNGLVVYYSNRCPFTEYYVRVAMLETAQNRGLPLTIYKLDSMKKAQAAPSPATIFSLFYDGDFVTSDLSICMDSRFDKLMEKWKSAKYQ